MAELSSDSVCLDVETIYLGGKVVYFSFSISLTSLDAYGLISLFFFFFFVLWFEMIHVNVNFRLHPIAHLSFIFIFFVMRIWSLLLILFRSVPTLYALNLPFSDVINEFPLEIGFLQRCFEDNLFNVFFL